MNKIRCKFTIYTNSPINKKRLLWYTYCIYYIMNGRCVMEENINLSLTERIDRKVNGSLVKIMISASVAVMIFCLIILTSFEQVCDFPLFAGSEMDGGYYTILAPGEIYSDNSCMVEVNNIVINEKEINTSLKITALNSDINVYSSCFSLYLSNTGSQYTSTPISCPLKEIGNMTVPKGSSVFIALSTTSLPANFNTENYTVSASYNFADNKKIIEFLLNV